MANVNVVSYLAVPVVLRAEVSYSQSDVPGPLVQRRFAGRDGAVGAGCARLLVWLSRVRELGSRSLGIHTTGPDQ
jgi:hypothetical protein